MILTHEMNSTTGAVWVEANLSKTSAVFAQFALQMHDKKMATLKMKVKVTERNIRNGTILTIF